MILETNKLEEALTYLDDAYSGRMHELAEKIGVSRATISVVLKLRTTTKRNARALVGLWMKETASETDSLKEILPPYRAAPPSPLGHIIMEGRDWSMRVPFYAEESLNQAAQTAATRLLKSVSAAAGAHTPPSPADEADALAFRLAHSAPSSPPANPAPHTPAGSATP